jgi:hypothetical protein
LARNTVVKHVRMVGAPKPVRTRLSAKNRAAIKLLDEWMSKPDDMGEEFWCEYEKELKEFRMHGEA